MPRVVLADDHPLLMRGLQDLMSAAREFEIVGTTGSGRRALALIKTLAPDLAVLDLSMPDFGGLAVQRSVSERALPVKVVILTATLTRAQIEEALQLGVCGLVLKDYAADTLLECMRHVAAGGRWLPPDLMARLSGPAASPRTRSIAALTQREHEVAALVCEGLSNRAIAVRLRIAEGTAGMHLQNIYLKLGVSNRTMLAALQLRHELTNDD